MPNITLPYNIQNGDVSDADKLVGNINAIVTEYNTTIGAASGDIIDESSTQDLNNKTLVKPTIESSKQAISTDTDAPTIVMDLDASNVHVVTLGGDRTLSLSNVDVGQYFAIELIQDATGTRLVTWFSTIKWVGGTAPTLTTTPNKKDSFVFRCTSTNTFDGYIVGMSI